MRTVARNFDPVATDVGRSEATVTVPPMPAAPTSSAAPGTAPERPRRRMSPIGIALLAVVAGLGIGRFVTAGNGDGTPAPSAPAFDSTDAPTEQIRSLEAAVEARPQDAEAWRRLGTAYAQRSAEVQDPELTTKAEEAFDRASALAPDDARILVGRGALELTLHRFAEAEELGREATRRLPRNADALGVLVDAQVELGQYDEATATLQEMLDVRPGLPALARTSYLRELNGDLDAARDAMRQAAVAGAGSTYDVASVTALLGDLQRKSGDLDAARASYNQAVEQAPELVTAQVGAAWVQAAMGDVDGAIDELQASVDEFPSPPLVLLLHDLQVASGDPDAADTAEVVRAVAALQEASGQVVDLEMAIFEADAASDPERALEFAEAAQRARPDNIFVDDAMAWSLFRSGDASAAAPFMAEALRLGSTEPLLRYHAAEIALAEGDRSEAAEHLSIALRDPWFSFQHRDRALELADLLGVPVPAPA